MELFFTVLCIMTLLSWQPSAFKHQKVAKVLTRNNLALASIRLDSNPLSDNDLQSISKLLSNAFDSPRFLFKAISIMDFNAQLQDRRARLVNAGKNHTMLVARDEMNEVVGFLEMGLLPSTPTIDALAPHSNEITASTPTSIPTPKRRYPTIGNLVIRDTHRRQGIAKQLLARAESLAVSWEYTRCPLVVAVDPVNTAALALYRTYGFADTDKVQQDIVRDLRQSRKEFLVLTKILM